MLGSRARIGIVVPATNTATEAEFWPLLPAGVTLSFARAVSSRDPDQKRRLSAYRAGAIKGALELAEVRPNLIVWACTSGSFINGAGYDRELAKELEATVNVPVLTTSTALLTALRALGVQRLAMGTPYPRDVTDVECRFFEDSLPGLKLVKSEIIDIKDPYSRGLIEPEEAYELARRADAPDADAVFLSCTDLQTFEVIERLERELEKPVISSNLATLWAMFGALGLRPAREIGQLWRHRVPAA